MSFSLSWFRGLVRLCQGSLKLPWKIFTTWWKPYEMWVSEPRDVWRWLVSGMKTCEWVVRLWGYEVVLKVASQEENQYSFPSLLFLLYLFKSSNCTTSSTFWLRRGEGSCFARRKDSNEEKEGGDREREGLVLSCEGWVGWHVSRGRERVMAVVVPAVMEGIRERAL